MMEWGTGKGRERRGEAGMGGWGIGGGGKRVVVGKQVYTVCSRETIKDRKQSFTT